MPGHSKYISWKRRTLGVQGFQDITTNCIDTWGPQDTFSYVLDFKNDHLVKLLFLQLAFELVISVPIREMWEAIQFGKFAHQMAILAFVVDFANSMRFLN